MNMVRSQVNCWLTSYGAQGLNNSSLEFGALMADQQCLNDKCKHFVKHYSRLCSSECYTTHIEEYFFGSIEIPSLAAELRKNLEEHITIEEVVEEILSTQSGKSPRALMGFNLNSIKKKKSVEMSTLLVTVFSDSLREESLPPTFYSKRQGPIA